MKVQVYGYGSMGQRRAECARAYGCDVAVRDADPKREWTASKRDGFRVTPHRDPEVVIIATPASTHSLVAKQLVAEGYDGPLFVEKPLALSADDAAVFTWFSHPTRGVGYNWRRHPLVIELHNRYEQFKRPKIHEAVFWVSADRRTWAGADYADTLLECSHEIDLALHICGHRNACLKHVVRRDTAWGLSIQHEDGQMSDVALDDTAAKLSRGCRLRCEGYVAGYTVDYDDPAEAECLASSYVDELTRFLRQSAIGLPADCTFAEAYMVLRICDEARTSAATIMSPQP